MKGKTIIGLIFMLLLLASCRREEYIYTSEQTKVDDGTSVANDSITIAGFYLLNEGNMGSNKSTLDYYDYATGTYTLNIYANANPTMVQELGDVGNDLQIYGNRLYAVINCSNLLEVMDARTAKHIGTVNVPNCRYICFHEGYAYLTSYAGPVTIDPDYEQIGYVAKIDTATLEVVDTCYVGFQPDEIVATEDKLYVANSGGYMVPNYENTVSVIDIATFEEIKRIEVAINLHRLCVDKHQQLWVTSRGDYYDIPSKLYCVNTITDELIDSIDIPVSNFDLIGDSLYISANAFNYTTYDSQKVYGIVDVANHTLLTTELITDGTDADIEVPYGIKVNPITHDIYITDAGNYVSPGKLYCFTADGTKKWSVRTGDIPAHIAFIYTTNK